MDGYCEDLYPFWQAKINMITTVTRLLYVHQLVIEMLMAGKIRPLFVAK
jgi:hypothetical protein